MRRILVIYNPNSSQFIHVKDELLSKLPEQKGVIIGKFAIEKAPFEENVKNLKKVLEDGDQVIAAGGDATASVAVNAILESKKDVTLAVLPYGNFNDLARTLGMIKTNEVFNIKNVKNFYPLNVIVDGRHWRYASCYVTIGMTAEAVSIFDEPKIRKNMQKGHKSSWRSYVQLAAWYFKNRRKRTFIPEFKLNGVPKDKRTSDYAAVNGRSMSRVMKGGNDYLKPDTFRSETERTTNLFKLFILMARSILSRTPGRPTTGDTIDFKNPSTVTLQCEGENTTFENIKKIEIRKESSICLKVIQR